MDGRLVMPPKRALSVEIDESLASRLSRVFAPPAAAKRRAVPALLRAGAGTARCG